ncbi:hypothetical protein ACGFYA_02195 [Streptomyces sp. NPDC048305]|uniref:hypothetical protein n=1 Tax=Streptomyces sp. NPDC048305 TaxID=3365532 RepID=UPI0037101AC5
MISPSAGKLSYVHSMLVSLWMFPAGCSLWAIGSPLARHEKSATWFNRTRREQGRAMLFHGHLKSVLLRDPDPQYEKWEGTIWHSTRTDDLMREEVAKKRRASEAATLPHYSSGS